VGAHGRERVPGRGRLGHRSPWDRGMAPLQEVGGGWKTAS